MNSVPQSAPLASRGRRLLATAIDAILVPTVTLLLVMLTGVVEDAEDYVDNAWILHVLLLAIGSYLLLNGYTLWRTRQTLGKRIMGIALAGAAGAAVSWWRLVVVRAPFFALMYLLLVPPLALVPLIDHLMIFGKRRRCLHDRLAGTEVVRVVST
ncbi:MAG: RDD family protein [Pseudomonadales bacterium]|nr:RDD family protein [Pseudomonadales bacterium]